MTFQIIKISFVCFVIITMASCKKLVEVDLPVTGTNSETVFNDDATAIAAVTAIYTKLSVSSVRGSDINSLTFYSGLSGDELSLHSSITDDQLLRYYRNQLLAASTEGSNIWTTSYSALYLINSAIEGLSSSTQLTTQVKKQLLGESKFMRALYYFYLVNIYGEVPLILNTDYVLNAKKPKSPIKDIYDQMILDLTDAKELLVTYYPDATLLNTSTERVRPIKWAAAALLARVYLYTESWQKAETEATAVIDHSELYSLVPLSSVFLANNNEAIWQLQPVNEGWNTEEARTFLIPSTGFNNDWPVFLNNKLITKFQKNDARKTQWTSVYTDTTGGRRIDYYYSSKYKSATFGDPITEYSTALRLAELYLIRAEARANLSNLLGAATDLNVIRERAALDKTTSTTQAQLLQAIYDESAIEFFTEWGHRWLDLKRSHRIDEVMAGVSADKGSIWNSYQQLYPIPPIEIRRNPNISQNFGY